MQLSKISQKNGVTYVVIRAANGEYCTITIRDLVAVEMNKHGTAMSIKGQTAPPGQVDIDSDGIDMITEVPK